MTRLKSTLTSPVWMPCSFAAPRISSITSAEFSSAFDGMHPQLRHTPPGRSRSTIATFIFSCEARIAATYPPGPEPMIARSYRELAKTRSSQKRWVIVRAIKVWQKGWRSNQKTCGIFQKSLELLQEAGAGDTVDDAMIA